MVLVVGALGGGFCGLFGWGISRPKAEFTTTPLTLKEFCQRADRSGLPTTATRLYYAHSSLGFTGFLELYRFDAPVADCIEYGKHLLTTGGDKAEKLTPVHSVDKAVDSRYLQAMGLAGVQWFDIKAIHNGFEGHREASMYSGKPGFSFWIDTDHGRFFYLSSD